jgi:hypothetical protein
MDSSMDLVRVAKPLHKGVKDVRDESMSACFWSSTRKDAEPASAPDCQVPRGPSRQVTDAVRPLESALGLILQSNTFTGVVSSRAPEARGLNNVSKA